MVTVAAVLALCTTKGDGKSFDQVVVAYHFCSMHVELSWGNEHAQKFNFNGVMVPTWLNKPSQQRC